MWRFVSAVCPHVKHLPMLSIETTLSLPWTVRYDYCLAWVDSFWVNPPFSFALIRKWLSWQLKRNSFMILGVVNVVSGQTVSGFHVLFIWSFSLCHMTLFWYKSWVMSPVYEHTGAACSAVKMHTVKSIASFSTLFLTTNLVGPFSLYIFSLVVCMCCSWLIVLSRVTHKYSAWVISPTHSCSM